ncbi:3-methyl-2-oxobutanoate hydroxymethyltransferase [Sediminispirochaeta bajacaliforniensis]|uniref:3-methyl-2-oxobutanoate hydroxymethyltransferase n=1 Tax=Sediminispirochaeta bajacaliforniensis TaxID=148 RepID=UPI000377FB10|nr:3-methyl-2-oxobutanoate hydroxymethyltransferase [Sediminispirochaeta bajacaliforniensis]
MNRILQWQEKRKATESKTPIVMITAYDATFASICQEAKADWILVGDTLGMVVQGKNETKGVTVEQMAYHTAMVRRGAPDMPVVADMPYGSFSNAALALENGKRLMDAGGDAVKFEGADTAVCKALSSAGIPVMGHLGLLPQTAENFRVQGKDAESAAAMIEDAKRLEEHGAFSIVLECIPESLAERISAALSIPTIGIGAGARCGGQVLVINDMLGLTSGHLAKFVKTYADLRTTICSAVSSYGEDVRSGRFPDAAHTYH